MDHTRLGGSRLQDQTPAAMKARLVRCCAWLVAALFAAPVVAWSQEPLPAKRVLMLYGHDPNAPGVVAFTTKLHAIVQAETPTRVVFYDELLDLERFPENARREGLLDYILEKYRGFSFDAIVTEGTRALQFATERVRAHFPGIPIVYGLAFEPVLDFSALPANVTGTRQPLPFAATFELARALQPDAERVVLIGGTSPNDSVLLATAVRDMAPLVGGMQLEVWQDWSYASLFQRLRSLPPRTIAILSAFSRDQRGQYFSSGDLIASVTRSASAPVYGIARNWVGDGIVGGVTMDFGDDGVRTGRLLLQVLDRAAGGLPLPSPDVARPAPVVDSRALERWGLSEGRLLPGTQILFQTPTVWQRYRTLILAIAAVVALQSVLIASLLLERRRRSRALRMVEEGREQLAHIARVVTVGELTAAISHELRQPLTAIRAHAEAGAILLDRAPFDLSETREVFRDIVSDDLRAVEVLDHIRALLRKDVSVTASVDLNGICEHAAQLLVHDAARRGVQLRLSLEPRLPPVIGDGVQLQQVVLNLALNAMDAVQASPRPRAVVLGTSARSGEVEIFVRDTGPGLSPEVRLRVFEPFFSTKTQGLGMGLAIVRSIVERHRGRVRADNEDAGGAVFRVQLPIANRAGVPLTASEA
jgi:signal transduction histidine kinase